jgi:hypothetical protein
MGEFIWISNLSSKKASKVRVARAGSKKTPCQRHIAKAGKPITIGRL